ncbi:hypothetical protein AYI70_g4112 [Smittium culicis]|uniref:Uncharacterized protein n=1 Tax=Smittium culicis TaxID=133412 RepID=A0A1R1Y0G5_9FUNG|nr:hypothetical protein AYI70_g4112 [Smittium culicis]
MPIRSDEKNLLSNFNEARLGLVGKLLGGEAKQSLSQLRAGTADQNFELETAKFLNGIRVPRTLILQSISDSPAPLNQCPGLNKTDYNHRTRSLSTLTY